MEVFPERDGNCFSFNVLCRFENVRSEWRSSLKGMETLILILILIFPFLVRMEVFPERDGNVFHDLDYGFPISRQSEWRSSLKGMETRFRSRAPEPAGNGSEWRSSLKGMETCITDVNCHPISLLVRMEVFPERDGNILLKSLISPISKIVRIEVFPERDGNF